MSEAQQCIEITLSGAPVPWAAARVIRGGRYSFSPRYREKEHHQWEVASQYRGDKIEEGPITLRLAFHMPIPEGTSKKQRAKIVLGQVYHTKKPDIDNCSKYAIDCVKGLIFKDDNQIVSLYAVKIYSENPKTLISILKCEG